MNPSATPDVPEETPARRPRSGLVQLAVAVGVILVLLGLLMPLFATAREKARRACCNCNLKQIGLSLRLYSGDHKGCFPTDPSATTLGSFALLTNNYQTSYKTWICSTDRGVQPGSPTRPWTLANLSYAYGGFGLTEQVQPDTPLVCDRTSGNLRSSTPYIGNKFTHGEDGGGVLFADGHVAFLKTLTVPRYHGKNP